MSVRRRRKRRGRQRQLHSRTISLSADAWARCCMAQQVRLALSGRERGEIHSMLKHEDVLKGPSLGTLRRVEPRSIWKSEAVDFTPWLANNLAMLGEALGLELDLEDREGKWAGSRSISWRERSARTAWWSSRINLSRPTTATSASSSRTPQGARPAAASGFHLSSETSTDRHSIDSTAMVDKGRSSSLSSSNSSRLTSHRPL